MDQFLPEEVVELKEILETKGSNLSCSSTTTFTTTNNQCRRH